MKKNLSEKQSRQDGDKSLEEVLPKPIVNKHILKRVGDYDVNIKMNTLNELNSFSSFSSFSSWSRSGFFHVESAEKDKNS